MKPMTWGKIIDVYNIRTYNYLIYNYYKYINVQIALTLLLTEERIK